MRSLARRKYMINLLFKKHYRTLESHRTPFRIILENLGILTQFLAHFQSIKKPHEIPLKRSRDNFHLHEKFFWELIYKPRLLRFLGKKSLTKSIQL